MKLDPQARSNPWRFVVVLFMIALLPRLLAVLFWSHEPVWDGHYYHFGAQRIAEGLGYSEDIMMNGQTVWKPWTHYPVGYSAWLSIFYRYFSSSTLTAPLVNALTGASISVIVFRLARYGLSEKRARLAGILTALHPGLIIYSALVMTEMTAALFLLLAAWSALAPKSTTVKLILTGLSLAAAVYIRPASLVALPALFLLFGKPIVRASLYSLSIFAVVVLAIAPWTYRNCKVMDECALVSTNGGWNLAIGALTTTGRFRSLNAHDGCPVVTGQVQQDRCWAQVGRDAIQAQPIRWLKMMPLKLAQTFNHESFAIEYLHEASPDQWPEKIRTQSRQLLSFFHWCLLGVAALSAVGFVRKKRRETLLQASIFFALILLFYFAITSNEHPFFLFVVLTPLLAILPLPGRPQQGTIGRYSQFIIFGTALTHAVFFGDDRYHLVLSPFLCLLAASALRTEELFSAKGSSYRPKLSQRKKTHTL